MSQDSRQTAGRLVVMGQAMVSKHTPVAGRERKGCVETIGSAANWPVLVMCSKQARVAQIFAVHSTGST